MGRTVSRGNRACTPRQKTQPTAIETFVAETISEAAAHYQDEHAYNARLITEIRDFGRRLGAVMNGLAARNALIEQRFPEIQAGQRAAEQIVARRRGCAA